MTSASFNSEPTATAVRHLEITYASCDDRIYGATGGVTTAVAVGSGLNVFMSKNDLFRTTARKTLMTLRRRLEIASVLMPILFAGCAGKEASPTKTTGKTAPVS